MKRVSIVYYSGSGHTAQMAEAVLRGASAVPGVNAQAFAIRGTDIVDGRFKSDALLDQLTASDAIVFGTPTYLGGPAAQFKAFVDATGGIWYARKWAGKLAAGFTHSGSPSGDKLSSLQYLSLFAAQHGMIWVGNAESVGAGADEAAINRVGSFLGVMGFGSARPDDPSRVHPGDLATAELLGRRVAALAAAFTPAVALAA